VEKNNKAAAVAKSRGRGAAQEISEELSPLSPFLSPKKVVAVGGQELIFRVSILVFPDLRLSFFPASTFE